MSIQEQLTDLKEKIDNAQIDKSKLEGKKEQLMSQLKEKFKVNSIPKAENLLVKMKKELTNMKDKLESGMDQFEEDYGEALNDY